MTKRASSTTKRSSLLQCDPDDLVIIGLDTKDGSDHELWDERSTLPIDESMVANIMALGVKETVTVRRGPMGALQVVNGRQRVRHAREANKRLRKLGEPPIRVPAIVEAGDEKHMGKLTISLNEIRKDDDLLVKAAKCMRLLQRNGRDYKEAAMVFGVSVVSVKNWAKVAELTPKVKKAIASGVISASAAAELHGLEKSAQAERLDKLTALATAHGKKKATVEKARQMAGRQTAIPKRVLLRLIQDKTLSPDLATGIKLVLGAYIPPATSQLGRLLAQAGYRQ
jgi:ParB family chromosome partitioning protein